MLLVVLVVFVFLRSPRTTMIPSVAVPVSLIGTFGVMYLCGYSLDNLSLMALTISTGFVVDDAIVVIENITRYLEQGMKPFAAALRGAREIGSTVLTISVSLVAVFIPLLLMGGIVGRLFREFAVTMSVAIAISMADLAHHHAHDVRASAQGARLAWLDVPDQRARVQLRLSGCTGGRWIACCGIPPLRWAFWRPPSALNVYLFIHVPKGFFPQQDNGRLNGTIIADQDTSFQAMESKPAPDGEDRPGRIRPWIR